MTAQLQIGELRDYLQYDLKNVLQKVINAKKKLPTYYILVHADRDPETGGIRTKLVTMNMRPPRMLGTILYRMDNTAGKLERIWCLPFDISTEIESDLEHPVLEVVKSAKGIYLVH